MSLKFLVNEFKETNSDRKEEKKYRVFLRYNNEFIGCSENYNSSPNKEIRENLFKEITIFITNEINLSISEFTPIKDSGNHKEIFTIFPCKQKILDTFIQDIPTFKFCMDEGQIKDKENQHDSGSNEL